GLMGTVGAVCVAIAVLVAITLTPALLGLAGERVLSRRARARAAEAKAAWASTHGAAARADDETGASGTTPDAPRHAAPRVMPTWRAVLTSVLAVALLLVVAIPALSMRLGLPDGGSEPEGSTTNEAFVLVEEQFGAGANSPIL